MEHLGEILALGDIAFSYPGSHQLLFEGLDLHLNSGRVYAVLGFSGSGKTTLLKIVGGILTPSRGTVVADPALEFGYVPQESSLLPWLSVGSNIVLGNRLLGKADRYGTFRRQLIEACALEKSLARRPRALSGGMKQRAAVISALTSGANLILLDEPFAGSDRRRKDSLLEGVRSFVDMDSRNTVIFTTHDPTDVFTLGATAIWLESGSNDPTKIEPEQGEWHQPDRKRLLELMIGQEV